MNFTVEGSFVIDKQYRFEIIKRTFDTFEEAESHCEYLTKTAEQIGANLTERKIEANTFVVATRSVEKSDE